MDFTVSGTARNGGKARILIQRRDLAPFGFDCGQRYAVHWEDDAIVLNAHEAGTRKVAKLVDKRRDHTYQTIDLRFLEEDRQDIFNGAQRLNVTVTRGTIIIKAA